MVTPRQQKRKRREEEGGRAEWRNLAFQIVEGTGQEEPSPTGGEQVDQPSQSGSPELGNNGRQDWRVKMGTDYKRPWMSG